MYAIRFLWFVVGMLLLSWVALAAKVGDVANGKILSESDTVLSLRIRPCSGNAETMMFSAPWKKRFVAKRKCPDGTEYEEYQIEQSPQFSSSTAAKVGDVAEGLLDQRTGDSITLNIAPCQPKEKSQYIVFTSPFKVRDVGEGSCPDGRKYGKNSIEQLSASSSQRPDWQIHIDWAVANVTSDPGETNCVDKYLATEPSCVMDGGRSCLMQKAIKSAKAGDCSRAIRLTLITQCHNQAAQQAILEAGESAMCAYLKAK